MQYTVTISRPKGAKEGEQLTELERTTKWWGRPHRSLLWPYEEDIQWTRGNLAGGRQKRPRNKYLVSFPIPLNVLLVSFPSALPLSHTQEDGRGQRNLYNCGSLFFRRWLGLICTTHLGKTWQYPFIKLSKPIQTLFKSDSWRIYSNRKQLIKFQFNESSWFVGQWSIVSPMKW